MKLASRVRNLYQAYVNNNEQVESFSPTKRLNIRAQYIVSSIWLAKRSQFRLTCFQYDFDSLLIFKCPIKHPTNLLLAEDPSSSNSNNKEIELVIKLNILIFYFNGEFQFPLFLCHSPGFFFRYNIVFGCYQIGTDTGN